MTPRYVVLSKAADNSDLWSLPSREVLHSDGGEVELFPPTTQDALRPALIEPLREDLVRIYIDDDEQAVAQYHPRILDLDEAIEAAGRDWATHGSNYLMVTTPAGDIEWQREWEANGKPPVVIGRQTIEFVNVATAKLPR